MVTDDLRLLAVRALQLAAHQQVERLVGAAELDVGLDRHRVVPLQQRVQELHHAIGRPARYRFGKSSRSSICATVSRRRRAGGARPCRCAPSHSELPPHLGSLDVEHQARLFELGLGVRVDLARREHRARLRRPDGSPTRPVKSPTIRTATWPASWNCRSLRSTTAWPSVRSGRLGSIPSFTRSGRPSASFSSRPSPGTISAAPSRALDARRRPWRRMLPVPPAGTRAARGRAGSTGSGLSRVHSPAMHVRRCFPVVGSLVLLAVARDRLRPARRSTSTSPLPLAQTSFLYAADGSLITELHAAEDRVVLRRATDAADVRDAAVAIEDRRFYAHHGVDVRAIARAAAVERRGRHAVVEGGSTITQQLVKNLYVGDADTFRRKIDEARSRGSSRTASRRTRSSRSTSTPCTSARARTASRRRPGRTSRSTRSELTLAQSALLAGLITAPNHFDPFVHPDGAYGRRNVVLRPCSSRSMIDARGLPRRRPRADRAPTGARRRPLPVPLLRRLLQAVVPREPGVRRQQAGPLQAAVHRRPAHHDHARPPAAGAGGVRGAIRARLSRAIPTAP